MASRHTSTLLPSDVGAGVVKNKPCDDTAVCLAAGGAVATALLTVVSGGLYGRFGADAFLAMAMLCAVALPLSLRLR